VPPPSDRLHPISASPNIMQPPMCAEAIFLIPCTVVGRRKIPFFRFALPIGSLLTKPHSASLRPPLVSLCPRPPEELPERRRRHHEPTVVASSSSPTVVSCLGLLFRRRAPLRWWHASNHLRSHCRRHMNCLDAGLLDDRTHHAGDPDDTPKRRSPLPDSCHRG
jgi:hypothetical protein